MSYPFGHCIRWDMHEGIGLAMVGNKDLRAEVEHLRAQNTEAAAFLDGLADRIDALDLYDPSATGAVLDASTADCRAMAAKLRG